MKRLTMIKVTDYDYNNTGQIKSYCILAKHYLDLVNAKEFHDEELSMLESEGYTITIIKEINLHLG